MMIWLYFDFMAQQHKIDFTHGNLAEEDNRTQRDVLQGTPKGYTVTPLVEQESLQKLYLSLQGHKTSGASIYWLMTEENRV